MNKMQASGTQDQDAARVPNKRIILSMGGKGGVGKTSIIVGLAEWFDRNQIPVKLLDLDTENKARGSLTHSFIDHLADGAPVVLADMGAGSG
jgi:cellulose biosynthesis protein BcsQ